MIVESDVGRVRIVIRSDDAADVRHLGDARKLLHLAPILAAVFSYLQQAVVRADVNQTFFLLRLGQRRSVAIKRSRRVFRDRVDAPNPAHDRQLIAIETAREFAADRLPRVTTIVTAIELVGGHVESRVQVRAEDERRIPVPARRIFVAAGLWLNADALARAFVEANDHAVLQRRINGIRIFRIDLRTETIAAIGDEPVGIDDARRAASARWTTKAEVVLRAAVDVVERLRVVGGDVVKLRHRKVLFEVPVLAAIVTLVNAAVATDEVMIGVRRLDPDVVIVDVLVLLPKTAQRAAAIV